MRFRIDSKRLQMLMIEKQLPVDDAARAAGLTRQGLRCILTERKFGRMRRERTVYGLARALGVPPLSFASPIDDDDEE